MLDNSIKQHLFKKNITINSEIITGFDTEYVPIDWRENELLSAQLSFTHMLKITFPIFKNYEFEGVNTLTSETYLKALPKFEDVTIIKDFITNKIIENRFYKFGEHDKIMNKIINSFTQNTNYKNVVVNNRNVIMQLNKSPIQNVFILPIEGEKLQLSFKSLIKLITDRIDRKTKEDILFNKIKYLDYNNLEEEIKDIIVRSEES
jgi:hypothetical protein